MPDLIAGLKDLGRIPGENIIIESVRQESGMRASQRQRLNW
jgi:hypothetical protein